MLNHEVNVTFVTYFPTHSHLCIPKDILQKCHTKLQAFFQVIDQIHLRDYIFGMVNKPQFFQSGDKLYKNRFSLK
jgi:hypothetical protein